ncbi:DUF421 domain-containing protein [Streptomyces sp. WAC 00631]|uniref:DUF421 domain-containing protein n=1 Tax=unclassified Streptomyces TaxID=2593676 RepID=UPI000F77798D|nr:MULTISPECIES: YetF domain-containing protein [unclassified Streptomyces]MCC5033482.1 DUF421 domain-containing protein [Streptomyces sp. WAC 00631]MCC9741570.1 DUF421 domain-containing protein [Streptomyces sp. MNU89]
MLFDSWYDLGRVAGMAALGYLLLVGVLRVSGKRTLAKLNSFDLVVTVALGSALATILLNSSVSLSEGAVALGVLIALQALSAWSATRSRTARKTVKQQPTLLLHNGEMLRQAMARQRITAGEVRQALRTQGVGDIDDVAAVVLETDGGMSVVTRSSAGSRSALADVQTPEPAADNETSKRSGA